ncbi:MAG: hypothetical protein Q9167_006554 [Letrouitia subvulpina]
MYESFHLILPFLPPFLPTDNIEVYYWATIRKNRSKYSLTRGISEDDVTSILLHQVVVAKDLQKAEALLLQLKGLRKYYEALKTAHEKDDFKRHMRKYLNMWLPDCPFEVSTTNRYTIVTHEAATTARRIIKKGDTIKYLCGNLVAMTSEEEKDLDLTRRDFSIVMSSRKKTPSLFLGPARFSNHDCNANARLVTRGSEGMQVVAVRDIDAGDEITVTYGDNYFGEDNCECLCLTCENTGRGAWAAEIKSEMTSGVATPSDKLETLASKSFSRRQLKGHYTLDSSTPELSIESPRKRRKLEDSKPLSSVHVRASRDNKLKSKNSQSSNPSVLRDETMTPPLQNDLCSKESTPMHDRFFAGVKAALNKCRVRRTPNQDRGELEAKPSEELPQSRYVGTRFASLKELPRPRTRSSLATVKHETSFSLEMENLARDSSDALSDPCSIFDNDHDQVSSPGTTPSQSTEPSPQRNLLLQKLETPSDSELSDLPKGARIDDSAMTVIHQPKKTKRETQSSKIIPSIEVETTSTRFSGDYFRTPLLLGERYSRWVDCQTCSGCWVQQNGYLTRKECPRCERHSKLYGFQWPKTEKLGKHDNEERVMDHRTVHRFIRPEEEKTLKKRGRGVLRASSQDGSRTQSATEDSRAASRPISRLRAEEVRSYYEIPLSIELHSTMANATLDTTTRTSNRIRDPNTLSNYDEFLTTQTITDFEIDFQQKCLFGRVDLRLKSISRTGARDIFLDTSNLNILKVKVTDHPSTWDLLPPKEPYGSALKISLEKEVLKDELLHVSIDVKTTDRCTALQWLAPAQTSNGKHPYMFSQCQPIRARSIFPCQDTPDVKSVFEFSFKSPLPVIASGLPTGIRDSQPGEDGEPGTSLYTFKQDVPIPSYLFAVTSGDIATASIGPRSTVATGPEEIEGAKWELEADTERFIQTAEKLLYDYVWSAYNVLVLPPSFPSGGMENPVYTYATPTIISGDRQNVNVIAHEISHSWSGNLVSWTVYLERRILAAIHGESHRDFAAIIGWKALSDAIQQFGEDHEFTKLVIDLKGKDPDDAYSVIPYEKGFIFLYHLEKLVGQPKWDKFIPHYFTTFKEKSLDSDEFKSTLLEYFASDTDASKALQDLDWQSWFYRPGFPPKPEFNTSMVDVCYALAAKWEKKSTSRFQPRASDIASWTANQTIVFLQRVEDFKPPLGKEHVREMGKVYKLMDSRNVELVTRYFTIGLISRDEEVYAPTVDLLGRVGRMKFVRPL